MKYPIHKQIVRLLSKWAWEDEVATANGLIKIEEMSLKDGAMEMRLKENPKLAEWTAACFAQIVADAPNYAEMQLGRVTKKGELITVLIQKASGKTPHQLRREAEAEVERLKAELASVGLGVLENIREEMKRQSMNCGSNTL